jgi:hypothetical protein
MVSLIAVDAAQLSQVRNPPTPSIALSAGLAFAHAGSADLRARLKVPDRGGAPPLHCGILAPSTAGVTSAVGHPETSRLALQHGLASAALQKADQLYAKGCLFELRLGHGRPLVIRSLRWRKRATVIARLLPATRSCTRRSRL